MNNNARIAKKLVRIAKSIVANSGTFRAVVSNPYGITVIYTIDINSFNGKTLDECHSHMDECFNKARLKTGSISKAAAGDGFYTMPQNEGEMIIPLSGPEIAIFMGYPKSLNDFSVKADEEQCIKWLKTAGINDIDIK